MEPIIPCWVPNSKPVPLLLLLLLRVEVTSPSLPPSFPPPALEGVELPSGAWASLSLPLPLLGPSSLPPSFYRYVRMCVCVVVV